MTDRRTPPEPHTDPAASSAPPRATGAWHAVARLGRGGAVVVSIVTVALLAAIVATALTGIDVVLFAVLGLVILLTLIAMLSWRVRVDERGLTVASVLGWPRTHIALDDIREVSVTQIHPLRDFGGWGWRIDMTGRSGVVLRRGPAIEVVRASGRRFVVTVADAATGAEALAARIRQPRRIQ